ncbi:membrane alanyl aminopeptidase [Tribonema minus]|uniref:Aminopeptidase n=1 Tax=Tribonema minus TaxID=303371 RepID=A0A835ZQ24_9STRA|nr:membrane alanyl aminopeptidase [Tribonema minus]
MGSDKAAGRVLLPPHVEPRKYNLRLEPDLERFSYEGLVKVDVEVVTSTNTITVHSKDIAVHEVSFTPGQQGSAPIAAIALAFDLKLTTLSMTFPTDLPAGPGTLEIRFTGTLNNQMAGFYRSGYTAADGEKRMMASTQFEALDARRCFPCWDEPARKAVFEVTMVIPTNRAALSNMPEAEVTLLPGGKTEIRYMPSPLMSSYLLAFCVGEFDFLQGVTKHGVSIRVYTPPGKKNLGRFALQVALDTLDLYDDFFQVPYPLPKLDMIAIPDFAMGAMENWGLVTYREVDLLIDDNKASSQQRQRVCSVITHELAHQWFGNLVTMNWWDDLWLNEGFASWTQTFAADALFPSWAMWEQFTTDDQAAALRLDSLKTSHPIQVPIAHAEEVEQVFDAISYCKGACVVRMLHSVIGADKFKEGLQVYMNRHKYANTETFHLWSAWEEVSGKPVGKIMSSWTEQMGHPVVKVTEATYSAADKSLALTLEQSWFLADGSDAGDEAKLWTIPLVYSTKGVKASEVELMEGKTHTLKVPLDSESEWVKLNAGQHTLMRVAYTDGMLSALTKAIKSKALPAEDRVGMMSDAYALTKAGKMGVEQLVALLPAYSQEDNTTVWESLEMILVGLDKVLQDNAALQQPFKAMAAKLIAPCAASIGWDPKPDDGHLSKLLRGTMIRLLGRFAWDTPAVQEEAKRRFTGHCEDPEAGSLPSEYAAPVYQIILKSGGTAEFDQVMAILNRTDDIAQKKQVYAAIGAANSAELKKRVMEWAVTEVKLQDFFYPINSVAGSGKLGQDLAWAFFKDNFERLRGMLGKASPSLMDAVILYSSGGFCDHDKAAEVEQFFKDHPLPSNARKISQVLEGIRINATFLQRMTTSPLADKSFWDSLEL